MGMDVGGMDRHTEHKLPNAGKWNLMNQAKLNGILQALNLLKNQAEFFDSGLDIRHCLDES